MFHSPAYSPPSITVVAAWDTDLSIRPAGRSVSVNLNMHNLVVMSHHWVPSLVLPRLRPGRCPNLVTIILLLILTVDTNILILLEMRMFSRPVQPWWKASLLLLVWKSSTMRWSISNDQERWFQIIGLMDFVSTKKWNEMKFRTELNSGLCWDSWEEDQSCNGITSFCLISHHTTPHTTPDQTRGPRLDNWSWWYSQSLSYPVCTWWPDLDPILRQNGFLFEL